YLTINDRGQIVGARGTGETFHGNRVIHAVLWTHQARLRTRLRGRLNGVTSGPKTACRPSPAGRLRNSLSFGLWIERSASTFGGRLERFTEPVTLASAV